MMKDNLEDFIRTNRSSFDQSQPDLGVWAGIDKALEKRKPRRVIPLWRSLSVAASVALLLGMGTLIGLQLNGQPEEVAFSDLAPEVEEMRLYYEGQLREKTAQLTQYEGGSAVREDLQQMEGFLLELQNELREAPRGQQEQIVNAMIENYQDRLAMLERVLSRIQTHPQELQKSNDDEKISL